MMVLTQNCAHCSTHRWRRWQGWPRGWGGARCWLSWMCRLHIAWSRFTQMIAHCWWLDGVLLAILTGCSRLAYIQHQRFHSISRFIRVVLRQSGVTHIDHYLDDYITMGAPGTSECQHNLSIMLDKCEALGVPIAPEKLVGPSSCLTFLGIEIDTDEGVMRLPAEKLARIQSQVRSWSQRRVCRRRQLESLIGLLQHACRVVRPGRSFLRRMISLLSHSYRPYHHIRLTKQFRADLCWWHTFLPAWNGVFVLPPQSQPSACFASDASGQWGCGARWDARWFQFRWPQSAMTYHISFLELVAVLMCGDQCGEVGQSCAGVTTRQQFVP